MKRLGSWNRSAEYLEMGKVSWLLKKLPFTLSKQLLLHLFSELYIANSYVNI